MLADSQCKNPYIGTSTLGKTLSSSYIDPPNQKNTPCAAGVPDENLEATGLDDLGKQTKKSISNLKPKPSTRASGHQGGLGLKLPQP